MLVAMRLVRATSPSVELCRTPSTGARRNTASRLLFTAQMSLRETNGHDPWWFAPMLYAVICVAVAAIVLIDLIAGWFG